MAGESEVGPTSMGDLQDSSQYSGSTRTASTVLHDPTSQTIAVPAASAPAWVTKEVEAPLGERDMGGWQAAVYTSEQQQRLGIDEFGKRIATPSKAARLEEEEQTSQVSLGKGSAAGHSVLSPNPNSPHDEVEMVANSEGISSSVYASARVALRSQNLAESQEKSSSGASLSELADAPHVNAKDLMAIDKQLMRAEKKFKALDVNGDGVLSGDEIIEVAEWVWGAFHPGGDIIDDANRQEMTAKILTRVDGNDDGCLSFDEFACYFVRTAEAIMRFRKKYAGSTGRLKSKAAAKEKALLKSIEVPAPEELDEISTSKAQSGDNSRYWYQFRLKQSDVA